MHDNVSRNRGDEFYTKAEDVDRMLSQYLSEIRGMHVLCPCDSEDSEYVRFFLENGIRTTFSSGDYDQYDFGEYDLVATNPPFSRMSAFIRKCKDEAERFHVIAPHSFIATEATVELVNARDVHFYDEGAPRSFIRPDGTELHVGVDIVTTFPTNAPGVRIRRMPASPSSGTLTTDGRVVYDRTNEIPEDWEGDILVPQSFLHARYDRALHEVVGTDAPWGVDGRRRFRRLVVRRRRRAAS